MKMHEALEVIQGSFETGYMVHFERVEGCMLASDYFPDKHAGEPLIDTEEEAWALAHKFAAATRGRCVNLYVVNKDFTPVRRYRERQIVNR